MGNDKSHFYMRLPAMFVCLSVCLSVSKITQKRANGLGWNCACRQVSGHGRTDQLLNPIWIIVRMQELENLKVEDFSKSVKQAPHSEQATGHVMHRRETKYSRSTIFGDTLFTSRCRTMTRKFRTSGQHFSTTYGCGATGRQSCPIFGFWPIFPIQNP